MRVLLLGGTTEAGQIAQALAGAGIAGVYSYAGRTAAPPDQPLPVRIGGFGGVEGLAGHLRDEGFTHLVDATHPFAAGISTNAIAAAGQAGVPLIALVRPGWTAGPGDRWTRVADLAAAVAALPAAPASVFLAIGRQGLAAFAARPGHRHLVRLVDAPGADLPLPGATVVVGRGPFTVECDLALLRDHAIEVVVAKDAGGDGAQAKLDAARMLGLPVILIDRPVLSARLEVATVAAVMRWLHRAAPGAERGV